MHRMFEAAPYTTFCMLTLMIVPIMSLRRSVLDYAEANLPELFLEFNLQHENTDLPTEPCLFNFLNSDACTRTHDPIFIALCRRLIRWIYFFMIACALVLIDVDTIAKYQAHL